MKKKILIIFAVVVMLGGGTLGLWAYVQAGSGYQVYVYRFNTRDHQLEPEQRTVAYAETEAMVQAVFSKMYEVPRSPNLQPTIPSYLLIDEVFISGTTMEIRFPAQYNELPPYDEALLRASLVQTMTYLPFIDIEGIRILVEGEELIDPFGKPLGIQTRERVLVNEDILPRRETERTFTLFFVSEDMELVPERRTLDVPDAAVERSIVEQLIEGSHFEGRITAVPSETTIRDILVEGSICAINFSEEFISGFQGHQTLAELTLRSIVYSITENVSSVTSVRFLIEAEPRENFNGVPYFDSLFEREPAG